MGGTYYGIPLRECASDEAGCKLLHPVLQVTNCLTELTPTYIAQNSITDYDLETLWLASSDTIARVFFSATSKRLGGDDGFLGGFVL